VVDGVTSISVVGLSVSVSDFVTLTGDIGFSKNGTDIVAAGNAVGAALSAGDDTYVKLANADFGLEITETTTVFELKNGEFSAAIPGMDEISATGVLVQYTDDVTVAANSEINAGAVSYTFENEILPNTISFEVTGISATLFDFFWITGNVTFTKSNLDYLTLEDGNTIGTADGINDICILRMGAHIEKAFVGLNGPYENWRNMGQTTGWQSKPSQAESHLSVSTILKYRHRTSKSASTKQQE